MQPQMPLWFQRLPTDLRRRLELAEAAAVEARAETHARQALNLVAVFASRIPFDQAVDRYIRMMDLAGDEAEVVRSRALVALSETQEGAELVRERHRTGVGLNWRHATPRGAVRFVRRQMRRSEEEELWDELSSARAEEALVRNHVKHALQFVEILAGHSAPDRAVRLYLEELAVPSTRGRQIYQRALARVAEAELPRGAARPTEPAGPRPRRRPR